MSQTHKTNCPNCGVDIDVNELLYQQLDRELRQQYHQQLSDEQQKINTKEEKLVEQQQYLQKEQAKLKTTVQQQVDASLQNETKKLRKQLGQELQQEQSEYIKAIQSELSEKSQKLTELNKVRSHVERLKREKKELKAEIELDIEKKYSVQLADKTAQLTQRINAEVELKVAEKEQLIDQLKNKLSEAQRKAEQGSSQLQGEVQELAIEQWLKQQFPLDDIEEIKKGAAGADTLQIINTQNRINCGQIYYESKRTKSFQTNWITKFKDDIQAKGADVGVLVTQTMPEGMSNLGQINGVWVCTFNEFKNLSQVLRQSLIQINQSMMTQENKGDKMVMLYDYLTSNEFRMQIEAIVDGFTQLKTDLAAEQRAMQSIWKKREKQIERVLLNTNYMYSSVKGIAGNAIQEVSLLELDEPSSDV